jgi:histidinol-phosphate aminotransferase
MLAQHLAAAALRDAAYMRENAQRIRQTRLATTARLRELGCTVLPSETNFLFVRPPKPAAWLFKALRDEGYLVRYFNLPRVSEYLRVTIGTETEMQGFIETMARLLAAE